jgi:hypothetical protein
MFKFSLFLIAIIFLTLQGCTSSSKYSYLQIFPNDCDFLPPGDRESDDFASGKLETSKIKSITIVLVRDDAILDFYADGCQKIKQMPSLEIVSKEKIGDLVSILDFSLDCDIQKNCFHNTSFNREYRGTIIAKTTRNKKLYFWYYINQNGSVYIKSARYKYDLGLEDRRQYISKRFINWILPNLMKLEK